MNIKNILTGKSTRSYIFFQYWKRVFSILFCFRNKVYIVCHPVHPNLGDQAQLMCTDLWLKENFPQHKIIHLGYFTTTLNYGPFKWLLINTLSSLITICIMKIKSRPNDIFIGHSGYFFVDHHNGYKAFMDIIRYFPKHRMIIFPQTINFYTPYIKRYIYKFFKKASNVTLLCRDEVSYNKAKDLFPQIKLLLYPDIVTSLIGTRTYSNKREGILFCMRDDIEAYYKPEEINNLMNKFEGIRKEKIDTTLHNITRKEMDSNRESIINKMIEKIASYKVVITDRYHGTIFSAIASTPVIVISSADHKLSSGVKWFPNKIFKDAVQYAKDLEEAYYKAVIILQQKDREYNNPTYFKNEYWNTLKETLSK